MAFFHSWGLRKYFGTKKIQLWSNRREMVSISWYMCQTVSTVLWKLELWSFACVLSTFLLGVHIEWAITA
jgi:hypothetical protein